MSAEEIVLCMGSSCFTRGNNKNITMIKNYFEGKDREVKISGCLCEDDCMNGPHIRINGRKFSDVTEEKMSDILGEEL